MFVSLLNIIPLSPFFSSKRTIPQVEWASSTSSFACTFTLTNPVKIDLPEKFVEREQHPPKGSSLDEVGAFFFSPSHLKKYAKQILTR